MNRHIQFAKTGGLGREMAQVAALDFAQFFERGSIKLVVAIAAHSVSFRG